MLTLATLAYLLPPATCPLPPLPLAYTPFISPLPGVAAGWYLTLPPLCVAVAVVYKAIKCHRVSQIPREAAATAAWIFFGLVGAGAVLLGVLWLLGAL